MTLADISAAGLDTTMNAELLLASCWYLHASCPICTCANWTRPTIAASVVFEVKLTRHVHTQTHTRTHMRNLSLTHTLSLSSHALKNARGTANDPQ